MYTLKELLDKLDTVCENFDNDYDLNSGGCCFAASVIAKYFDKYDIEYYLVVEDATYEKNKTCVLNEIKNRKPNRLVKNSITGIAGTSNHYYLYVPGYGNINNDSKREYSLTIKVNHKDIAWIYKKGDWNSYYDTNNNEKFINLIKSIFENYEES